jgi:hypothetical protein
VPSTSRAEKRDKEERLSRNEQKWTAPLMQAGWTVIPSVLLERQQALGLDAIDINIILHLARYWWYSDNPPHPSKRTIAECMGIDESTVRRRIARMERDGLLQRIPRYDKHAGQQGNEYHFEGLIQAATPYAQEVLMAREQQQQETAARRTRKRSRLQLVTSQTVQI